MAGITFSHPNPTVGNLHVRLAPTEVSWGYNLNTSTVNTYGGQVVQILSINFEKLTIKGQFGKEGPHGAERFSKQLGGAPVFIRPRPIGEQASYSSGGKYGVGLTQMTEYFRRYFAVASQGHDRNTRGNYSQQPMKITYAGTIDVDVDLNKPEVWLAYPTSFPSYKRSNEAFAPEWMVEFEVYEAPSELKESATQEAIDELRDGIGYIARNKFSDPLAVNAPPGTKEKALKELQAIAEGKIDEIYDYLGNQMPAYTPEALNELITSSASLPYHIAKEISSETSTSTKSSSSTSARTERNAT